MTDLEIAVTSAAGAVIAREGGATRVELCAALELGGLTPSAGLLQTALERLSGVGSAAWQGVHVLIRPRPGDFVYDADTLATAEREVRTVLAEGADGVVVGVLTPDGRVDRPGLRRLVDAARSTAPSATVTLHRALDQSVSVVDEFAALLEGEDGPAVDRVLTSGGAPRAGEAVDTLTTLVDLAAGRIEVMAGGGVELDAIPAMVDAGVSAIHLSAKRRVPGAARIGLGAGDDDPGAYLTTDPALVAAAAAALSRG